MDYLKELIKNYKNKIYSPFLRAIKDYSLISENDNIAVAISGGKDSFIMALCFKELEKYSDIKFNVKYMLMDPGYSNELMNEIEQNIKLFNLDVTIFKTNIFKISNDQEKNKCYICAKMRRGALYNKAKELGCNKLALGHHYDDVIETLMMSILYSGEIGGMKPIVKSDNYDDMFLIRPMYYVKEKNIIEFKNEYNINFLKGGCLFTSDSSLCESSKRNEVKKLISELDLLNNDYVSKNIFRSMSNVNLNKLNQYKIDNKVIDLVNKNEKMIDYSYHTHTSRCGHAKGFDEEYVLKAIKKGFKILGFSDHVMLKGISQRGVRGDFELLEEYINSINSLKEKYKKTIAIYTGFESEYSDELVNYYKNLLENKVDYLILGQHFHIENNKLSGYFYKDAPKECLTRYIDDVIGGIKSGLFKYLCHPDLFVLEFPLNNDFVINEAKRMLEVIREYDFPVEINLNGYKRPLDKDHIYPNEKFFKLASEYNVKVIIGVDAHYPDAILDSDYEYALYLIEKYNLRYIDRIE